MKKASIIICILLFSVTSAYAQATTPPKDPIPGLVGQLSDEKRGDAAADVLGSVVPSDQSRQLLRLCLKSANQAERGRAALVLGQWHDAQSAPEIEQLFFNNDAKVRQNALAGYSMLYQQTPERYSLEVLVKVIETEKEFETRKRAVDVLKQIPGKKTDDALPQLMKSVDDNRVLSRQ